MARTAAALAAHLGLVLATAAAAEPSWVARPGISPHQLLVEQGGALVSSDAVARPDGGQALIVYIRVDAGYFRCIDWRDASFRTTGEVCYELTARATPASN